MPEYAARSFVNQLEKNNLLSMWLHVELFYEQSNILVIAFDRHLVVTVKQLKNQIAGNQMKLFKCFDANATPGETFVGALQFLAAMALACLLLRGVLELIL